MPFPTPPQYHNVFSWCAFHPPTSSLAPQEFIFFGIPRYPLASFYDHHHPLAISFPLSFPSFQNKQSLKKNQHCLICFQYHYWVKTKNMFKWLTFDILKSSRLTLTKILRIMLIIKLLL